MSTGDKTVQKKVWANFSLLDIHTSMYKAMLLHALVFIIDIVMNNTLNPTKVAPNMINLRSNLINLRSHVRSAK